MKGHKLENAAGLGADKICLNLIRKRSVFGNLSGGPHAAAQTRKKAKEMNTQKTRMKGNENPKDQNERKPTPKQHKMKGNQGPKGQNERKSKPKRPKNQEMVCGSIM